MIITGVITDDLLKLLYREPELKKESSDEVLKSFLMKTLRLQILSRMQTVLILSERNPGE